MSRSVCAILAGLALAFPALAQDEEAPPPPPAEADTSLIQEWTGTVSFGLTGSSGNTERVNLRGEVAGTRETDKHLSRFLGIYAYAKDSGEESENRGSLLVENDFKLEDPKWFLFARGQLDVDEFQDWDQRLSLFAGPGRVFIDNEKTKLSGRIGAGVTREFGGEDDDYRPELIISAIASHQLTERQKLLAEVDFFPSLEDIQDVRTRSRLIWEMLVDPEVNLSLRAGVEHRYDSGAEGDTRKSDVDYFILLSWAY